MNFLVMPKGDPKARRPLPCLLHAGAQPDPPPFPTASQSPSHPDKTRRRKGRKGRGSLCCHTALQQLQPQGSGEGSQRKGSILSKFTQKQGALNFLGLTPRKAYIGSQPQSQVGQVGAVRACLPVVRGGHPMLWRPYAWST